MLKKADVATDITSIKNNYVTNASLSSQLNDLKSQHITDEVKKVEDKVNENKKEIIFVKGFFSYEYHGNLVHDCKLNSFKIYASSSLLEWTPKIFMILQIKMSYLLTKTSIIFILV